jgi:N6-L-threonylcarbamoyladenine synthase
MRVLGIETSCDETAASVLEDGRLLSNVVQSQAIHGEFGGVVPEIASRAHIKAVVPIMTEALGAAGADIESIDAVAVTLGPGLIGALIVGVSFAKSLCFATGKSLVGVDHIEAHVSATYLSHGDIDRPFVSLVASGGHTHLFLVKGGLDMSLVGATRDDAAGEAFDKVAKMLGLPYPGGPEVDRAAASGRPDAVSFPRPVLDKAYDFSFSGLKTAVRYFIDDHRSEMSPELMSDIAASFQEAVVDVLVMKTIAAAKALSVDTISAVGGVASNSRLRERLRKEGRDAGLEVLLPPAELCTDNGAIIAEAGYLKLLRGGATDLSASPYSTRRYERIAIA